MDEDTESIIRRLNRIKPGEAIIYFVGYLDFTRYCDPLGSANSIAIAAYSLYQAKKVHLFQRRLSVPVNRNGAIDWREGRGNGFEYIALGLRRFI